MLINLSNHPFEKWDSMQKQIAIQRFGSVTDIPFPDIDPTSNTETVTLLVAKYLTDCIDKFGRELKPEHAIHISGEPCFLFHFVTLAKAQGISCFCSTTHRMVTNKANIKTTFFQFVQFRKY